LGIQCTLYLDSWASNVPYIWTVGHLMYLISGQLGIQCTLYLDSWASDVPYFWTIGHPMYLLSGHLEFNEISSKFSKESI
jgi:hypothetical protein